MMKITKTQLRGLVREALEQQKVDWEVLAADSGTWERWLARVAKDMERAVHTKDVSLLLKQSRELEKIVANIDDAVMWRKWRAPVSSIR